ncbi:MAG: AbgT family transporter [Pseudomonadota bacterium]
MAETAGAGVEAPRKGVLGWIERTGNALPDPAMIFFWLILALVVVSVLASALGLSAENPVTKELMAAKSLLDAEQVRRVLVEMPTTLTGFAPLGYVLVVMLGAGVAERTGLFAAGMRAGVNRAPKSLLTPTVAFVAMMSNLAADAAYVVLVPLAGVIYAAAGRHPIAGIAASFAAVSGGFSANLLPGQLDALLLGITEPAAQILVSDWSANIAGNWYFIAAMFFLYIPVVWFVTDRIIEPRLGGWSAPKGAGLDSLSDSALSEKERKGLVYAGVAIGLLVLLWAWLGFGPGAPLRDMAADPAYQLSPFYKSLVAFFFLLFLGTGVAYGVGAGTVKTHRDVIEMMSKAMGDMGYYIVLAFAAAHFVALFNWSNLGIIMAINGANAIEASGMPAPILLVFIILLGGTVNLFVGSASAKWALLAPILVPMLMLTGISPEMTTAAYRVGDSATNILTPLMVYFPLALTFCQRWRADFGLGSLMATMTPYGLWMLAVGAVMTFFWVLLGLPLGPGAVIGYELPS